MGEGAQPTASRADARRARSRRRRRRGLVVVVLVALVAGAAGGAWWWTRRSSTAVAASGPSTQQPASSTTSSTTTTTQPPGPGFVAGKVTAVGDSVMMDYQLELEKLVPGISVDGSVGRQWYQGEQILSGLKAQSQAGAVVVVGLSTNGPITAAAFDSMMGALSGASRVVFVNVHVDQPWQDPNNAVIADGVKRYPKAVLADWNALATEHPEWFGPDGTHISFSGPAPEAAAALIADKIKNG